MFVFLCVCLLVCVFALFRLLVCDVCVLLYMCVNVFLMRCVRSFPSVCVGVSV